MLFSEKDLIERNEKDIRESKELIEETAKQLIRKVVEAIVINEEELSEGAGRVLIKPTGKLPTSTLPVTSGIESVNNSPLIEVGACTSSDWLA